MQYLVILKPGKTLKKPRKPVPIKKLQDKDFNGQKLAQLLLVIFRKNMAEEKTSSYAYNFIISEIDYKSII